MTPERIEEVKRLLADNGSVYHPMGVGLPNRDGQPAIEVIEALQKRVAELEGALKPFANEGFLWGKFPEITDDKSINGEAMLIKFGDLRHASSVFSNQKSPASNE